MHKARLRSNFGQGVLIHHNSGSRKKLLLITKIIPPRHYQKRPERGRETCSVHRSAPLPPCRPILYILKIKINYIYLRQSPPGEIFILHDFFITQHRQLLCGWDAMCSLKKRSKIDGKAKRHLELTCKRSLWGGISADRRLHLSGSIKDFLCSALWNWRFVK